MKPLLISFAVFVYFVVNDVDLGLVTPTRTIRENS